MGGSLEGYVGGKSESREVQRTQAGRRGHYSQQPSLTHSYGKHRQRACCAPGPLGTKVIEVVSLPLRSRALQVHWWAACTSGYLSPPTHASLPPGESSSFRTNKWRIVLLKDYHNLNLFGLNAYSCRQLQRQSERKLMSTNHGVTVS